MMGVKGLPRKEKSSYGPEDIWRQEDHALFLKYCNFPPDRCWHAMVHDTSARPHEILSLKIKDLAFKLSSEGVQYAEIQVSGVGSINEADKKEIAKQLIEKGMKGNV